MAARPLLAFVSVAAAAWLLWLLLGGGPDEPAPTPDDPLPGPEREVEQPPVVVPPEIVRTGARTEEPEAGTCTVLAVFRTPEGDPLENVRVTLLDSEGYEHKGFAHAQSEVALSDVPAGPAVLRARLEGFFDAVHSFRAPGGGTERVVLELEKTEPIRVRVVALGTTEPLRDVLRERGIVLHRGSNVLQIGATRIDEPAAFSPSVSLGPTPSSVGAFRSRSEFHSLTLGLAKEFDGVFLPRERPPFQLHLAVRQHVLQTQVVQSGQTEVTFTITVEEVVDSLATLRFCVADAATLAPIDDFRYDLADASTIAFGEVEPHAGGCVEQRNVMPGMWQLHLEAPGYETFLKTVLVEPGRAQDLPLLLLSEAVELSGTLLLADGGPAIRQPLALRSLEQMGETGTVEGSHRYRTDPDGAFVIQGVGRGAMALVTLGGDAGNQVFLVETSSGGRTGLRLELQPTVPLLLRLELGAAPETLLHLRRLDGLSVASRRNTRSFSWNLAVPPGSYLLDVRDPTGVPLGDGVPVEVGNSRTLRRVQLP